MKAINQNLRMLTFLLLGITLMTTISCSEEDTPPETPEAQEFNYEVRLTKIRATDTSGEGDADNTELEIYGELSTSLTIGTTVDTRSLLMVELDDALSVGQNDTQLTGATTFTIAADDLANSSITCFGELEENDGGGFTQFQGEESSTFSLGSITVGQDVELTFSDTPGQTSVVTFTITRL
ncbi:MAG: hypothetical protein AAGL34_07905 [Bacteroidota bacterium]